MKARLLRLLILSSFVLTGCQNPLDFFKKKEQTPETNEQEQQSGDQGGEQGGEQPPADTFVPFKKKVNIKMEALLVGSDTPYDIEYNYDESCFLREPDRYDEDLALLSFGASMAATYKDWATNFLSDCEFQNPLTHDLDIEPTEDTLGYSLGHKTVKDFELFAVLIRGNEYKKEWCNNFIIGETGDHEGWLARATELYSELKDYVSSYRGNKDVKLWVVGYSRAGAISNILASLIIRNHEMPVNPLDMYVYTFEAPASVCEENSYGIASVQNIINSADLVTYIPPEQYGLYRVGNVTGIYDSDVSQLVLDLDQRISIPAYKTCTVGGERLTNDLEFVSYLVESVFGYEDSTNSAQTREEYVERYQTGLSYSVGLILSLSPSTRNQLMNALKSNSTSLIMMLLDSSGQTMADFIDDYLVQDNVSYDEVELVAACAVLIAAMTNIFSPIINNYQNDNFMSNLTRTQDMHYPEVTYCLINNYNDRH